MTFVLQAVNLDLKAAIINKNILNHYCVVSVLLDKEIKYYQFMVVEYAILIK